MSVINLIKNHRQIKELKYPHVHQFLWTRVRHHRSSGDAPLF